MPEMFTVRAGDGGGDGVGLGAGAGAGVAVGAGEGADGDVVGWLPQAMRHAAEAVTKNR
jgi:hypothetical protein